MQVAICLAVVDDPVRALGWATLLILFVVFLPFCYVWMLLKKKVLDDLHVPRRHQRIKPMLVTTASYGVGLLVFILLKAPLFLICMFAISIVSSIVLTSITNYWKISLHTSWLSFAFVTFYVLFGAWALVLASFIPLTGWARVHLRLHSVMQVIMGALVSAGITFLGYIVFGFIVV